MAVTFLVAFYPTHDLTLPHSKLSSLLLLQQFNILVAVKVTLSIWSQEKSKKYLNLKKSTNWYLNPETLQFLFYFFYGSYVTIKDTGSGHFLHFFKSYISSKKKKYRKLFDERKWKVNESGVPVFVFELWSHMAYFLVHSLPSSVYFSLSVL